LLPHFILLFLAFGCIIIIQVSSQIEISSEELKRESGASTIDGLKIEVSGCRIENDT